MSPLIFFHCRKQGCVFRWGRSIIPERFRVSEEPLAAPRVRFAAVTILFTSLVCVWTPSNVLSQQVTEKVSHLAAADSAFSAGLRQFELADYAAAHQDFEQIVRIFPLNNNTTAAALMSGKSSYRQEQYVRSAAEMEHFLSAYPTSGYIEEARKTLSQARKALRVAGTIPIGIVLSLDPEEATQTQALFNGIRLAVDAYNSTSSSFRIRMVFRRINRNPEEVRIAVESLAREKVAFIVGGLFSDQARMVAEAAESVSTVYVAPLATDENVSGRRRFVFQANPTISMRGRLMARFAINGLRLKRFGVIAREDEQQIGIRLTDAFVEEASRLGAEINLIYLLPEESSWYRIRDSLSADTLKYVDALYTPISAPDPDPIAGAILNTIDRLGGNIRILGNSAWHDLPMRTLASKYLTTYSNDFFPDPNGDNIDGFELDFSSLAGEKPGRLAFSGYDLIQYLIGEKVDNMDTPFDIVLHTARPYSGLASRYDFGGGNVNRALFYHRYRDGLLTLIR
jgi:ABC-type branched-subunit amino acid transport system substrate-binding protein